jgi:hypothetical protein
MFYILQRGAAIPVRALAWLGGQGTRAIAALVLFGIAIPPLGELLRPFVTEAVFSSALHLLHAGRHQRAA